MRMLTRMKLNWSSVGWFWFWAAALLVLPNCFLDRSGIVTPSNVHRGVFDDTEGYTSAIFCDIERPGGRRCPTPEDDLEGMIRLKDAAVALVEERTSAMGLDDSPAALARCGGQPEIVEFFGPFPEGSHVCLDCDTAIGPDPATQHASNADLCMADCLDLFSMDDDNVPPSDEAIAFCTTGARLSTNFPATGCFDGACARMGGLSDTFDDPRRHPEPVNWINLNGVSASGGTLTRTAPTTGFSDTGASSSQLIASGDAYFEFIATETTTARTAALSSGPPPPGGVTFNDMDFGILLMTAPAEILVVENGPAVGSFGPYNAGDRFRVRLRDNFDGTATVTYLRVTGPCVAGVPCPEALIHTSDNLATYPVRVDAMFREQGGTVTDARIVRIR